MLTPYQFISAKRDNQTLPDDEISNFIGNFMTGSVADYQMSAFLMATYFNGMTAAEVSALTAAYIKSGVRIDLSEIDGYKVDKHSTGGVGDKVSIVLAPLVASLDIAVPMISGRGLGHSGGTLDKLESIPGFRTDLSINRFKELLTRYRLALIGQTDEIVPADRRIYALRDVTATVESIPLIAASIMSKKIAEGIDGLVLDVKYGKGAFMVSAEKAESLAEQLISVGREFGLDVCAVLTAMEQPLGQKVGNWLEIEECLDCLRGEGPPDLREVTLTLCSRMVRLARPQLSVAEARQKCQTALDSGAAMERFLQISSAQGGDIKYLEDPKSYPAAKEKKQIIARDSGVIAAIDARMVGMASVQLGAGRLKADDRVDPTAGIVLHCKTGDSVKKGDLIAEIFADSQQRLAAGEQQLRQAMPIGTVAEPLPPLILKEIAAD